MIRYVRNSSLFLLFLSLLFPLSAQIIYPRDDGVTSPLEVVVDWSSDACMPENLPNTLGTVITTTTATPTQGTSEFSPCKTIIQPELDLNLPATTFLETVASGGTASDTLVIRSTGSAALTWSTANTESWLLLSPGSGLVDPGDSIEMGLTYNAGSLNNGSSYRDTVILTSNDPNQAIQEIPVEITVQAQPQIFMSFDTLSFTIPQGGIMTKSFTIFNQGSNPLTWNLGTQAEISWLHMVQPNNGTIPVGSSTNASLNVQDGSLSPGAYYAMAWVYSNDPNQIFRNFVVELIISAGGGGGPVGTPTSFFPSIRLPGARAILH